MDGGQTVSDNNTINGAAHRWVGNDTSAAAWGAVVRSIGLEDISKARFALQKANVPLMGLTGVIPPEQVPAFEALASAGGAITQVNPAWEPIVTSGMLTGMRFVINIFGFDIYTSNYLTQLTAQETFTADNGEVGDYKTFWFSAADKELMNVMGAWRRQPDVESEYNMNMQREEYVVTARYGIQGGYRPENVVTIICNDDAAVPAN